MRRKSSSADGRFRPERRGFAGVTPDSALMRRARHWEADPARHGCWSSRSSPAVDAPAPPAHHSSHRRVRRRNPRGGRTCDDGNTDDGDACLSTCDPRALRRWRGVARARAVRRAVPRRRGHHLHRRLHHRHLVRRRQAMQPPELCVTTATATTRTRAAAAASCGVWRRARAARRGSVRRRQREQRR